MLGGHSDLRIPVGSSCGRCVTPGVMLVRLPFRPAVERCLLHGPSPVGSDMVVGLFTSTVTGNDLGGGGSLLHWQCLKAVFGSAERLAFFSRVSNTLPFSSCLSATGKFGTMIRP